MRRGLATAACCLIAAPTAAAEVKQAQSVMPPGQSGFVSAPCLVDSSSCDPHLTDQIPLFTDFQYKNSMLGQPGAEETPKAGVRIVRDQYGVPAVYGDTEDDMWWGMGYAIAQDRLFQIEAFRRATTGTLSEILGKAALEDDIIARRDYYTQAEREQMIESLPGDLRTRWQAYADGVNAWIDEVNSNPTKMPAEYVALGASPEHLQVHEMAAIGIFLARTTPSDDGEELANLQAFRMIGPKAFNRVFPLRTPGQWGTVPKRDGLFPSRPGMTRKQERTAFKRSSAYARAMPLPEAEASASRAPQLARFFPSLAGSKMWAMRKLGHAWLLTGPQLGFVMPERLVEIELHSPSLNVRGTTAAGAPVIGIGHNEHVAWGVTSGLGDEDDLYAEELVGDEGYRFHDQTRAMECRDETFTYRPPPADLLGLLDLEVPDTSAGSQTERICRTVHGPVQDVVEGEGIAYARRYAIWKREVGTIVGLDRVNRARSIEDVDAAADELTWNENLMAADDRGNIGYWSPGLMPMRSKRFDERLPFPGTGIAEWKGLLPPDKRPQVINPSQGYLANWNNPPSFGATNGDGPAKERTTGPFHRGKYLAGVVARFYRRGPSFGALAAIDRVSGTHAQQRILARRKLKRAARGASGNAKVVLDAILAWDGDYTTTDSEGKVPAGVAAWDAFCAAARDVAVARYPTEVSKLGHSAGGSHLQECATLESFGLRTLKRRGYRKAARRAMVALEKQFGSKDPGSWKIDRPTYPVGSEGGGSFPEPFPFFDRGTWTELTELAP
jgi:acyl-homoserine lactone acylase PvdQ